jgi:predicted GTPase
MTQVESSKPVVSICASRTGVGKSQTTRYVAKYLKEELGLKVAVIRHPMPYAEDLNGQRMQRYEKLEDMDKYECTIEEREEYYTHIVAGNLLFAGVDYEMILREAEKDADVIIWDGGNNDASFYKPDLQFTLVDSLRDTDETHYYPGEINVRMADAVLIMKTNSLDDMQKAHDHAQQLKKITKPDTPVFFGASTVSPEAKDKEGKLLSEEQATDLVKGKRVLVVEDGPTLTHGGMAFGAGYALAKELGASEIIDPRPNAQGSLKGVFDKFSHLKNVLPAMGYGSKQVGDLKATIDAIDCDTVVLGTPSGITDVIDIKQDHVVARYELEFVDNHDIPFNNMLKKLKHG